MGTLEPEWSHPWLHVSTTREQPNQNHWGGWRLAIGNVYGVPRVKNHRLDKCSPFTARLTRVQSIPEQNRP